jgi:hypothetical protein
MGSPSLSPGITRALAAVVPLSAGLVALLGCDSPTYPVGVERADAHGRGIEASSPHRGAGGAGRSDTESAGEPDSAAAVIAADVTVADVTVADMSIEAPPPSDEGSTQAPDGVAGRVPLNHRTSDVLCLHAASPGNCPSNNGAGGSGGAGAGGEHEAGEGGEAGVIPDWCSNDSDCAAGTDGRCTLFPGPSVAEPWPHTCVCTVDTCASDTDCPSAQACACRGVLSPGSGNECVTSNCRVDSDCGQGGYCSLSGYCSALFSQGPNPKDFVNGYYCHTAGDLCIDDSDCTGQGSCLYSMSDSRWECGSTCTWY